MSSLPPVARLPILFLGLLSLIFGVLAGLARLAIDVPEATANLTGVHGALMIAAFLGTVISLERAVALMRNWAYLAPVSAGLGGLVLVFDGSVTQAQCLIILGSATLTFGSFLLLWRQPARYLATLALGALSWLTGSLVWLISNQLPLAVPWWMAFLILTIAGERLELTRFLPTTSAIQHSFTATIVIQLLGLTLTFWHTESGLKLYAWALVALGLWLFRNDIARRTVKQSGLTRFIAFCLLGGYFWLIVGGLLGSQGYFSALTAGTPLRDAALHSIFLGFVFSMIFGHAPIILPAVARLKINYQPIFYLPLLALHGSLLLRVTADLLPVANSLRPAAAIANGLALALFVLTMLHAVISSRHR